MSAVGRGGVSPAERWARAGLAVNRQPRRRQVEALRALGAVEMWERVVRTTAGVVHPGVQLARAAAVGARFVVPGDEEWPAELAVLASYAAGTCDAGARLAGRDLGEPFGLWVWGGPVRTEAPAVAVVGARAASVYGTTVARDLGAGLADRGYDVVSGAAYGIDAAAHRGALTAGGRTVAVLACGVDVTYPRAHGSLLAAIARDGVVLSEAPPGAPARREAFLQRNRLIAALSAGTVLVEAGLRSGARNVLAHARLVGRSRLVVPGPVTSATSAGCHAALRADPEAQLVTCAAEVLEAVGPIGELAPLPGGPADPRDALGQGARNLLELLPAYGAWPTGRVAATLALSPQDVATVVEALAAAGLIETVGDAIRLTRLGRAPTARVG